MAYPAFPYSPLPIGVELTISTGQHDITDDVDRAGWSITRGRSDEASQVGPCSFKFKVRNPTGTYSPRNPSSPLYGEIGRNTPVLGYVELGAARAVQSAAAVDYWYTADKAALDVTGDIDIRVDLRPTSWRPASSSWIGVLKTGAYGLYVTTDGYLHLLWNDAGAVQHDVGATVPIPGGTTGRKAIRATLDVNNGAGGHTVAFYLWTDGAWVQLGTSVVTAGTTSIINSTGSLTTYVDTAGTTSIYEVQVRNGIGGTLVANPVFTSQASGTTSFGDGLGNTWLPAGAAKCWNRHYRVNAEVSEWPPTWSEKGAPESFVEVQANGVLRRMAQGQSPLQSVLRRACPSVASLVAYWPFEDGDGSTSIAGYGTARPGAIQGTLGLAAYDELASSAALPTIGSSRVTLSCPATAATTGMQVRWIMNMPTEPPTGTVILRHYSTNGIRFDVTETAGWGFTVTCYASDGTTVLGTYGPVALAGSMGRGPILMSLEAQNSGGNVTFGLAGWVVGDPAGFGYSAATATGAAVGASSRTFINPNLANLGSTAIGHVTVQKAITTLFELGAALNGYTGEDTLDRFARLAVENGLDLELIGAGGLTGECGPQRQSTLLELLREAEDIDGGVLYEPDTGRTLAYRSLDSITRQTPLTLAYVENQYRPFEPTEDDQNTRNDITVTRAGGGSARAVDDTGALGVATIGRYDEDVTLNLAADLDAVHQAGWRLNLGTVDDMRWPTIGFNLADPRILADPLLVLALLELDIGDRLTITDLPEWLPPFPADVIVQGISENVAPSSWQITLNTSPAAPLDVAEADWVTRWGNDTTTLNTSVTTTATSWSVATTDEPLWTHADGDYDLLIGGEVVTVTNVTGASSPQTFTVVRSVNGVVKAHTAGAKIELYRPRRWSL